MSDLIAGPHFPSGGDNADCAMAVVLRLTVSPATQEQFNVLDDRVGEAMTAALGPPAGRLSHVAYPEAAGFVVQGVVARP